jgi:hypothetical protein
VQHFVFLKGGLTLANQDTIEIADDDEILWGADKIGEAISRNPRQANWLLTRGEIRCAQKRGKHWIAPRAALRREFGLR